MPRKTLLVVEDDDDLRTYFRDVLSSHGFEVKEAGGGLEALQSIDTSPPDVVVLDLVMPHVTGIDVLQELRAHAHTRGIPVVVVTGTNVIEDIDADCVLRKPVLAGPLLNAIARCTAPNDGTS